MSMMTLHSYDKPIHYSSSVVNYKLQIIVTKYYEGKGKGNNKLTFVQSSRPRFAFSSFPMDTCCALLYSSEDFALAADTTVNSGGGVGSGSYWVGFLFFAEGFVFLGLLLWWCFVDLN